MAVAERKKNLDWTGFLREAKEKIVKILWGLTGVSEGARELALKEILWELETLQGKIQDISRQWDDAEKVSREENDLLRSLLGGQEPELKGKVLTLGQDLHDLKRQVLELREENAALNQKATEYAEMSEDLRRKLGESEQERESLKAQKSADWQKQMSGFADEQTALQGQMKRLGEELAQVQTNLSAQGEALSREKQNELAALQATLLKDMEKALEQREDLLWAEEEIFARGVAQKLRGELQSVTGRLQLTLEKVRLLDPEPVKPVPLWKTWARFLKVGPEELRRGFREVGKNLHQAVDTLEEYLTLTHRRSPAQDPVSIPQLVRDQAGKLYKDRLEKGALELVVTEVLPSVKGDGDLLEKALQALLSNGFEALPSSGGRVRVTAEKSTDGREVWVTVKDSGPGLSASQRERLFQPFFTTKSGHRGLGLARARRYAEWHRGRVELVETGPQGTSFRLALPVPL